MPAEQYSCQTAGNWIYLDSSVDAIFLLIWGAPATDCLQDHGINSLGHSFPVAVDRYGCQAARNWYTTQERTELCRALLYAVVLNPTPITAATLADLLSLLESKAAKVRQAGANAPHALLQQATSCLLAVVAAVSLGNAAGGAMRPPAAVGELLRANEVNEHLSRGKGRMVSLWWFWGLAFCIIAVSECTYECSSMYS